MGRAATEGRGLPSQLPLGRCSAAPCFSSHFVPRAESLPFQKTPQGSWRMFWEFWPSLQWGKGETMA